MNAFELPSLGTFDYGEEADMLLTFLEESINQVLYHFNSFVIQKIPQQFSE